MRKTTLAVCIILTFAFLFAGCAKQYKAKEASLEQPVNCATAEADIELLQQEKTRVGERIQAGVMSIVPIPLVGGLIAGTTKTKGKIATGQYDKQLDSKIAEIKSTCNID